MPTDSEEKKKRCDRNTLQMNIIWCQRYDLQESASQETIEVTFQRFGTVCVRFARLNKSQFNYRNLRSRISLLAEGKVFIRIVAGNARLIEFRVYVMGISLVLLGGSRYRQWSLRILLLIHFKMSLVKSRENV